MDTGDQRPSRAGEDAIRRPGIRRSPSKSSICTPKRTPAGRSRSSIIASRPACRAGCSSRTTHSRLLFTPGRVTILGEGDGNRLRRIYTDGRPHPRRSGSELSRSFHRPLGQATRWWSIPWRCCRRPISRSTKRWACRTTATCTSSSGMHLLNADTLADDLEITANKLLVQDLAHDAQISIGSGRRNTTSSKACASRAAFTEAVDKDGNSIFRPHQVSQWRSRRLRLEVKREYHEPCR